mmetsp:Transcript_24708/g.29127  ORF Transcript_24708/g.29127 Transcript_24708/m.29127 type:complete len:276 (-) Transcript_24708:454-1281(-)
MKTVIALLWLTPYHSVLLDLTLLYSQLMPRRLLRVTFQPLAQLHSHHLFRQPFQRLFHFQCQRWFHHLSLQLGFLLQLQPSSQHMAQLHFHLKYQLLNQHIVQHHYQLVTPLTDQHLFLHQHLPLAQLRSHQLCHHQCPSLLQLQYLSLNQPPNQLHYQHLDQLLFQFQHRVHCQLHNQLLQSQLWFHFQSRPWFRSQHQRAFQLPFLPLGYQHQPRLKLLPLVQPHIHQLCQVHNHQLDLLLSRHQSLLLVQPHFHLKSLLALQPLSLQLGCQQ